MRSIANICVRWVTIAVPVVCLGCVDEFPAEPMATPDIGPPETQIWPIEIPVTGIDTLMLEVKLGSQLAELDVEWRSSDSTVLEVFEISPSGVAPDPHPRAEIEALKPGPAKGVQVSVVFRGQTGIDSAKYVGTIKVMQKWIAVTTSGNHTCAIGVDRAAYCWGGGSEGGLGTGKLRGVNPQRVVGLPGTMGGNMGRQGAEVLSAGFKFSCGMTEADPGKTGIPFCWGSNAYGKLGADTDFDHFLPTPVALSETLESVSAGIDVTCAIIRDNRVMCWGRGSGGGLGDDGRIYRPDPLFPDAFKCLGDANKDVWCTNRPQSPVFVTCRTPEDPGCADGRTFAAKSVSTGERHACGISEELRRPKSTPESSIYCWGLNDKGQLGTRHPTMEGPVEGMPEVDCRYPKNNNKIERRPCALGAVPVAFPPGVIMTTVTAGFDHTCALSEFGRAWCWGDNSGGQVGVQGFDQVSYPAPVAGNHEFSAIAAGRLHTCALTVDGDAYCWGENGNGKLGQPESDIEQSVAPVPVSGGHKFSAIAVGKNLACAITKDHGWIYCWGNGPDIETRDGVPVRTGEPGL